MRKLSAEGVRQLLRLRIRLAVGVHGDFGDDLVLFGLVGHHVAGLIGDAVHHVHAVHDAAEGGVLPIQMGGVLVHDEELAAGRVHGLCAGHAEDAAGVAKVVADAVGGELTLDAVAGAAHAGAVGAAALDHEAGDDAVEDQTVVEAGVGQGDEVIHALGCDVGIQLAGDDVAVLHLDGDDRIGHNSVLVSAKYKVVSAAVLFPHGTVHLPFGIPLGHGIPLIVGFLTLTQAQLHLHAGVFEVDGQGDQGVTILLLQSVELADLPLVQQQALGTVGVAVEDVALLIGGDVEAVGIDLAVLGDTEGILQVQRAGADGFDLRAEQLDAGLVAVLHKIVVERFAVLGGDLDAGLFHGRTSFPCGLIHIV